MTQVSITLPKSEQDKFRAWVKRQTAETKAKCQRIVQGAAIDLHRDAVQDAPVHYGRLRGAIHIVPSRDRMGAMVFASVNYAPYMEFGTGKHVRVPAGYEAFAWQFKGRGIREVNLKPRPYFISNYEKAQKRMIRELNKIGFR